MFSMEVIDTDQFLELPLSTQALYFHLGMRSDDDGFVGNPRKITKMLGATDIDLKLLCETGFLIPFENGVMVITHFQINNNLRSDRYNPTIYQDEKNLLSRKINKQYTLFDNKNSTLFSTKKDEK